MMKCSTHLFCFSDLQLIYMISFSILILELRDLQFQGWLYGDNYKILVLQNFSLFEIICWAELLQNLEFMLNSKLVGLHYHVVRLYLVPFYTNDIAKAISVYLLRMTLSGNLANFNAMQSLTYFQIKSAIQMTLFLSISVRVITITVIIIVIIIITIMDAKVREGRTM